MVPIGSCDQNHSICASIFFRYTRSHPNRRRQRPRWRRPATAQRLRRRRRLTAKNPALRWTNLDRYFGRNGCPACGRRTPTKRTFTSPFQLPSQFKPVGPGVESDVLLASISTTIHLGSGTIRGQSSSKVSKKKPFKLKYSHIGSTSSFAIKKPV